MNILTSSHKKKTSKFKVFDHRSIVNIVKCVPGNVSISYFNFSMLIVDQKIFFSYESIKSLCVNHHSYYSETAVLRALLIEIFIYDHQAETNHYGMNRHSFDHMEHFCLHWRFLMPGNLFFLLFIEILGSAWKQNTHIFIDMEYRDLMSWKTESLSEHTNILNLYAWIIYTYVLRIIHIFYELFQYNSKHLQLLLIYLLFRICGIFFR